MHLQLEEETVQFKTSSFTKNKNFTKNPVTLRGTKL